MEKLGVTRAYLVNLGDFASDDLEKKVKKTRSVLQSSLDVESIESYGKMYRRIESISRENDIVFSTIDPWTPWLAGDENDSNIKQEPMDELPGALFVGPAAYAAAHHGAPVVIMESHDELSNAKAWHNRFWMEAYRSRKPPSVACMVLTGHEVYDLLGELGIDGDGMESVITVAGQFDIGTAWDRMLVGAAVAGRICGSPTDTSCQIARSVFYPAMIFANPGVNHDLDPLDGKRITGTESSFEDGARIIRGGGDVSTDCAVMGTWISQRHRFNERASRYWGADYVTADGITPFRTPSGELLDYMVNADYGAKGTWPDMTISEVVTYYYEALGYDVVHDSRWDEISQNLNRGVVLWIEGAHGSNRQGGIIGFWAGASDSHEYEKNPWRAYESGGSTDDPDTVNSDKNIGLDYHHYTMDPDPYNPGEFYHDGLVTAIAQQINTESRSGYDFDRELLNIHSVGMSGSSCLIANSLLHMALQRHGSVFQVIDPWLTSWYSNFAIETFVRDLALGLTVGEAYANGIKHVGIGYLTDQWWWDIFENVVYYGDPDLRVYSPLYLWDMPLSMPVVKGKDIGGHAPGGADEHPDEIEKVSGKGYAILAGAALLLLVGVGYVHMRYFREDSGRPGNGAEPEEPAGPAEAAGDIPEDGEEAYGDAAPAQMAEVVDEADDGADAAAEGASDDRIEEAEM